MDAGGDFSAYQNFDSSLAPGVDWWSNNNGVPAAFYNSTSATIDAFNTVVLEPYQFLLHPDGDVSSSARWTSPSAGYYSFSWTFVGQDTHGPATGATGVDVYLNGVSVWGGSISGFQFTASGSNVYELNAGDVLDFTVNHGNGSFPNDYYWDSTGLAATVTNAVPEPGSLLALGVGLFAFAPFIRRQR